MRSVFIFIVFAIGITSLAVAQPRQKGKVIFFDDFKSSKLDTSKWNVVVTGFHVNNELQAYVDSNATLYVKNNKLVLQPLYSPGFVTHDGQYFDFISARINTKDKFEFEYGRAEARIQITNGAGLWPAWWILGNDEWPQTGEIDVMENVGDAAWSSAAIHGPGYSGETPFVQRYYYPKNNHATQWHIYAVNWTPDSMVFEYDGKPMYTVTKAMTTKYGPWAFSNKKYLILNFALGGNYPAGVNKVKQPYLGLPEKTVKLIQQKQAKMLVDWVKVTQYNAP
ncbi:glycoside hydrolase family 16 protein [Hydrotalea sp.]|uniref:glycoside hydrolase family 16 protein n=1 Tax=Hydrotalea sp. TaxID=2881279 RepID=UPI003D1168C4